MQTKRWSLRLDAETRKLLDLLATEMQRSRASVIKVLIHQAAKTPSKPKRAKSARSHETTTARGSL